MRICCLSQTFKYGFGNIPWNFVDDLRIAENLGSSMPFVCWDGLSSWGVCVTDHLHKPEKIHVMYFSVTFKKSLV